MKNSIFKVEDLVLVQQDIAVINHVSFEFYQEKHKEYYLATQLVQFMYYLLLQADHEENTLQDYHHSLQNVSLLFIYIIKKIFLLKKLLLMEI